MASVSGSRAGEEGANASGSGLDGGSFMGEGDLEDGIWACPSA